MTDQCKNCTYRGDLIACTAALCHKHEDWYAVEIKKRNDQLADVNKELVEAMTELLMDIGDRHGISLNNLVGASTRYSLSKCVEVLNKSKEVLGE